MHGVQLVGNGFIRSVAPVRHAECINAFPTRGGRRFGYDEARANPSPGTFLTGDILGNCSRNGNHFLGGME